jgi:uncharacterized membrane protein YhaH (DUF805 family)
MEWMFLPLKRYFEMSGRSRRKEYWMFVLFNVLVGILAAGLDALVGFSMDDNGPFGIVTTLALFVPGITVWVRRLHDTDRSAWWILLVFIPILGWIALLVFACQDGTSRSNSYGEDPKNPSGDLGAIFS